MKNKFNRWLTIGTINHVIFLVVILLGYVAAGYKLHGDDFGGVMMVYGLTIFFPQLGIELYVIIMLLTNIPRTTFREINKLILTSFIVTFAFVVIADFVV